MKISIENLSTDTEPDPPQRIAFCANLKYHGEMCGTKIFDNDILAVQVENGTWVCGPCVEDLLKQRAVTNHEDAHASKVASEVRWRERINVAPGRGRHSRPTRIR